MVGPALLALLFAASLEARAPEDPLAGWCEVVRTAGYGARVELADPRGTTGTMGIEVSAERRIGPQGSAELREILTAGNVKSVTLVEEGKPPQPVQLWELRTGDWVVLRGTCAWVPDQRRPFLRQADLEVAVERRADGGPGGAALHPETLHSLAYELVKSELDRTGRRDLWGFLAACERLGMTWDCLRATGNGPSAEPPTGFFSAFRLQDRLAIQRVFGPGIKLDWACGSAKLEEQCQVIRPHMLDAERRGAVPWYCDRGGTWATDGICRTPAGSCRLLPPAQVPDGRDARGPDGIVFNGFQWGSGRLPQCGSGAPRLTTCMCVTLDPPPSQDVPMTTGE